MAKVLLKLANSKDLYLQKTSVENLFIDEFLPGAPGEYVKVYLFGLMYAQNNLELEISKMSRILKIREEDLLEAWGYWSKKGLVKINHTNDNTQYDIEYNSLVDNLYGNKQIVTTGSKKAIQEIEEIQGDANEDVVAKVIDREVRDVFNKYEELTGRMLSVEDAKKIRDAIKTYSILPDLMSYSVDYCFSQNRASVNQIIRTAVNWAKEGCSNLADVKELIQSRDKRNSYYSVIFKTMGFMRLPSPPDKELMDRWFDEMEFTIKDVLDACNKTAGMRDPSLKYVNKILENQRLEQGGINAYKLDAKDSSSKAIVSNKVLQEYYAFIRSEEEKKQQQHINEVCSEILEMKELFDLEKQINKEILVPGNTNTEQRQALRDQKKQIEVEKRKLLHDNGYAEDYLDKKYKCKICNDSGLTDTGMICSCREKRAQEALKWNLMKN